MATWTIFKRLNVSPASFATVIHIKQYTSDFILKFQLYSTDGDLNIEAGATTKIRGTKRDGNGFELTGTRIGRTCTFSGTKAQMQQITAVAGTNVFEVVVETETRELITATFHVEVQRAAMDAGTVTSESIIEEFTDFQSKITAAQAAATAAQAQADRAEAAAASVDFGLDSVPTQGSTNAVSSGGVKSALDTLQTQIPQIDIGYTKVAEANSIDVSDYAGETIDKCETAVASPTTGTSKTLYCCGKNHLVLGESGTSYTVTYTVQDDGGIKLSGTADRVINISPWTILGVYNKKWRFSIQRSAENSGIHIRFNGANRDDTYEFQAYTTAYYNEVRIRIESGTNCNDCVIYPMIEFGDYASSVSYEKFYGFYKSHTLVESEDVIDWGELEIPENAVILYAFDTADTVSIYKPELIGEAIQSLRADVAEISTGIENAYAHELGVIIDGWNDVTVVNDVYINSSGTTTGNGNFQCSDYVDCEAGDVIRYNLYGYSTTVYIVTFYNASKERISGIVGATAYTTGQTTAPTDTKYVRFSTDEYNLGTFAILREQRVSGDATVTNLKGYIDGKTTITETNVEITKSDVEVVSGSIYTNIGLYNLASGRRTDYIPVSEGDTIEYDAHAYIGTSVKTYTIAVFNASKVLIDYVLGEETGYVTGTYTIPEGGAYVIISWTWAMQHSGWFRITAATITKEIVEIANRSKSPLAGEKWCVLGDSITYGANTTQTYFGYIEERTGVTPFNYGKSNTAIAKKNSSVTDNIASRYSSMIEDADIITVFGGTNDHGQNITIGQWGDATELTLYGAMKILVEGLINKYIGKKIGFILPLPKCTTNSGGVTTDYSYPSESFKPYVDCIKDVCARYSIPVLDLYTGSGISPSMASVRTAMIPDGLHPNATGHAFISWKIQKFLEEL